MPELGAEVLRRMGATVVTTPAATSSAPSNPALSTPASGSDPGSTWISGSIRRPIIITTPAFTSLEQTARSASTKTLWDSLTPSERALIEAAAQAEVTRSLAEFNAENVKSLKLLRADERIKIRRFSDELIKTFGKLSKEVLADTAAKDPLTRKVYDSYMAFLAGVMDWGELSETGYRDTRRLALG